jgi:hypothetical protein
MEARCYQAFVVLLPECNRARTQWASTGPVLLYFPFPAITPGAPGFRLQVKAGQGQRTTVRSATSRAGVADSMRLVAVTADLPRIHRRFIALRFIGSRMPGATDRKIGARFLGNCPLVTGDVTIGRR